MAKKTKKYIAYEEHLVKRLKDPVFREVYEERSANELRVLLDKITVDFDKPEIEYTVSGNWKVWVRGWHVHLLGGASYSSFTGYGKTPKEAAEHLLRYPKEYQVGRGDNCGESCPNYRWD